MALVFSTPLPRWCGPALGLAASILVASCATGSEDENAKPPRPSDGGFSGNEGGGGDATGGSGGSATGGSGGTGGTAGEAGSGGTGGSSAVGQCTTCSDSEECGDGFTCVTSPQGHPFCAADCDDGSCPSGDYECVDLSTYGATGADGGPTPTGKGCVPSGDESCPCTAALEGEGRPCFNTNSDGTCVGTETCKSGSWGGCDAAMAEPEICNGEDDNCNGLTDMEETGMTGNDLCAGGSAPPHSGFACVGGECQLDGCEDGWARYPDNLPVTAGCACAVDEPDSTSGGNETCADSFEIAPMPDAGGSPKIIEGTLSSDGDTDWYAFNTVDTDQVPSVNTYRVHIEFLQPDGNPGDEYLFDVIRGTASDACSGEKTSLTSYDWCADSVSNPAEPSDDDQSAPYRLKVYRNPSAASKTCNPYKIRITVGGSGACPAADACGA